MLKKMDSMIVLIIVISTFGVSQSQQTDDAEAPDNFRNVGKLDVLVRHAFPADRYKYFSKDMRNPFRDDVVDDEMLQFLKNDKVTIIFDVANLWTKKEIENARKKFGIDVIKKINLEDEEFNKELDDENIKFFLDKIEIAKENTTKVSVHCRGGVHRAGVMSAIYLIEKEGYSIEEAIKYWKINSLPDLFDNYLKMIGKVENWDNEKIISVKSKVAESMYKKEGREIKFLRNYKK